MASALISIDPSINKTNSFERFCRIINHYQTKGFFTRLSVASAIHPSLFPHPISWYDELKEQFMGEAYEKVKASCEGNFKYSSIKVLSSNSSGAEDLVTVISSYARRRGDEILIMASSDKKGLPYWILGSFSETASLTAPLPVLIIKPYNITFSRSVRIVLAVDVSAPPSSQTLVTIAGLAEKANAHVDLVYANTSTTNILKKNLSDPRDNKEARIILKDLQSKLLSLKIKSNIKLLMGVDSVAHAIADYAEETQAWLTITTEVKRTKSRKLLLGSTSRRILKLTKRPFLSMRPE